MLNFKYVPAQTRPNMQNMWADHPACAICKRPFSPLNFRVVGNGPDQRPHYRCFCTHCEIDNSLDHVPEKKDNGWSSKGIRYLVYLCSTYRRMKQKGQAW